MWRRLVEPYVRLDLRLLYVHGDLAAHMFQNGYLTYCYEVNHLKD
jgi:hypothetical protein